MHNLLSKKQNMHTAPNASGFGLWCLCRGLAGTMATLAFGCRRECCAKRVEGAVGADTSMLENGLQGLQVLDNPNLFIPKDVFIRCLVVVQARQMLQLNVQITKMVQLIVSVEDRR